MLPRMKLCIVGLAVLALGASLPASGQVPSLRNVPAGVSARDRAALQQERYRLQSRLRRLQAQGRQFNEECASVKRGSAKDAACARRNGVLEGLRLQYVAEVNRFNARIRVALKTAGNVGRTPAACVRAAGTRLRNGMETCEEGGRSCLVESDIGAKGAKCAAALFFNSAITAASLAAAPPTSPAVAYLSLGNALTQSTLDARAAERAATRCADSMDRCRVAQLKRFKRGKADCFGSQQ